jgi:hypothetical protein
MRTLATIGALALLAGCAVSPEPRSGDPVTAAWTEHAGSSRDRVVFPQLQAWKPLEDDWIAVRTRADDYFLLRLESACASDLRFSSSLSLAIRQSSRNVLSRFDRVLVGDRSCRIQEIRAVDVDAVVEDLAGQDIREPFVR